jgi:hypothetical protein
MCDLFKRYSRLFINQSSQKPARRQARASGFVKKIFLQFQWLPLSRRVVGSVFFFPKGLPFWRACLGELLNKKPASAMRAGLKKQTDKKATHMKTAKGRSPPRR